MGVEAFMIAAVIALVIYGVYGPPGGAEQFMDHLGPLSMVLVAVLFVFLVGRAVVEAIVR